MKLNRDTLHTSRNIKTGVQKPDSSDPWTEICKAGHADQRLRYQPHWYRPVWFMWQGARSEIYHQAWQPSQLELTIQIITWTLQGVPLTQCSEPFQESGENHCSWDTLRMIPLWLIYCSLDQEIHHPTATVGTKIHLYIPQLRGTVASPTREDGELRTDMTLSHVNFKEATDTVHLPPREEFEREAKSVHVKGIHC